jgi:hypothetical protein
VEPVITDRLIEPKDGAEVRTAGVRPRIRFRWEPGLGPYRLVIATGARLDEGVVVEQASSEAELELPLGGGVYRWGVFGTDSSGAVPLFVSPRRLTVEERVRDLKVPRRLEWGEGRGKSKR